MVMADAFRRLADTLEPPPAPGPKRPRCRPRQKPPDDNVRWLTRRQARRRSAVSPGASGPPDDAHLVRTPWEQLDRVLPPVVSLRLLHLGRPLTLRDCVPPWLRFLLKTRQYSPLTVRYYAEDLRAFIVYCDGFGVTDPRAVSEAVIETYLAALTGRGLKPATVSRPFYALRSFFKYCLREGAVDRDHAATSYGPKKVRHIPRYLTVPEWRRLLRRLATDRSLIGQRAHLIRT